MGGRAGGGRGNDCSQEEFRICSGCSCLDTAAAGALEGRPLVEVAFVSAASGDMGATE
ncbi:MAG: hypothetical protein GX492_10270 [Firmicutes bacterium]|nr:hypothetical protein [Bacillota bacterium]